MKSFIRLAEVVFAVAIALTNFSGTWALGQSPKTESKPPASNKPVKVYILSGQSNMVGMGEITGSTIRWGKEFIKPVVSVYEGQYDAAANYDEMKPIKTLELAEFGGVSPTQYPGGGTHVVRGHLQMKTGGVFEFLPGYGASSHCIMEVGGVEVHRQEVGKSPVRKLFTIEAEKSYPFKITYLTAAADGLGWLARTDIPGTLRTLVQQQKKFPNLLDDQGNWKVRNDVVYKGVISAVAQGPLTVGLQGNTIGPELQFGHMVGDFHDEPVLLIKASIGNRSLGWDILPPGSERFTFEGRTYAGYKDTPDSWLEGQPKAQVNWYAGKQYDEYTAAIHEVLNNFNTLFPQWKDQGYEVAGFVWWQGHKDGNAAHASRYEQNMVKLIKTWREEFKAPQAPWAIATIGFDGWKMAGPHVTVANAQLAVSGETGKYPEFKGNVKTVESRDYWREVSVSPANQGYHYNRNAETYMLVGQALGRAMVEMQKNK